MNSGTWGRSVRISDRLGAAHQAEAEVRDWTDDDRELEQWHQSHLGNLAYLAIFVVVTLVTVLAFVPVWLLVQAQRALEHLGGLFSRQGRQRGRFRD